MKEKSYQITNATLPLYLDIIEIKRLLNKLIDKMIEKNIITTDEANKIDKDKGA